MPENPKTADAAPPPNAPPVIRREDYLPPAWLVPTIALDFRLGLDATKVASKLTVHRNPQGNGTDTLRLNGDQITPVGVKVDGHEINDWRLDGPDLLIPLKSGEGRYVASAEVLDELEGEGRVAFRYLDNPNGSLRDIAGISSANGRVVGLMPHPEHAVEPGFGPDAASGPRSGTDGLRFFTSVLHALVG